jgi:hypothetical protein
VESAGVTAAQADALIAQTARAAEAMRFSPILRYSPYRRISPEEIERYTTGVDALASGLVHARTASRAASQASHRPRRLPAALGDWQGLCALLEPAVGRFASFVLDGSQASLEAAEVALNCALSKHAEVVAACLLRRAAPDIDRAVVLAETEHVLDDLRLALAQHPLKPLERAERRRDSSEAETLKVR